jgi:hypothetical protein
MKCYEFQIFRVGTNRPCSICGGTFDSQQTLDVHGNKEHSIVREAPAGVG